eukprot:4156209-Alexandrium_andersonii.AAC.1
MPAAAARTSLPHRRCAAGLSRRGRGARPLARAAPALARCRPGPARRLGRADPAVCRPLAR